MFHEPLVDIDTLRCHDEKTKPFLSEAIACYKAGAFRAAIVTTWITVVFDIIAKLRELELAGDKDALHCLEQLEHIQLEKGSKKAIPLVQEFERTILDKAKDQFELLSPLEYKDLLRLHEDRHRCAHPSMHSLEEPYQPTGELVRYHLRNAATFLLQQPPVQGKAAEKHIWADIHSVAFPHTVQEAVRHFSSGPLARVKTTLLRRLIVGLTKDILREQRPLAERQRQFAALGAILQMHHQGSREILCSELPKIVFSIPDELLPRLISYVKTIPSAWETMGETARNKMVRLMQSSPIEIIAQTMTEALTIPPLQEIVANRIPELTVESLALLLAQDNLPVYIHEAIRRWGDADSFDEAKIITKKMIIPLIPKISEDNISHIIELFISNNQLSGCFIVQNMMLDLFKQSHQYMEATKHAWVQLYEDCCWFINGKLQKQSLPSLLTLIEERYPDIEELVTAKKREEDERRSRSWDNWEKENLDDF